MVVIETVPALLSSVAFKYPSAPQDVEAIVIAGAAVSTVKDDDVTVAAGLPVASETSAVIVYACPFVRP